MLFRGLIATLIASVLGFFAILGINLTTDSAMTKLLTGDSLLKWGILAVVSFIGVVLIGTSKKIQSPLIKLGGAKDDGHANFFREHMPWMVAGTWIVSSFFGHLALLNAFSSATVYQSRTYADVSQGFLTAAVVFGLATLSYLVFYFIQWSDQRKVAAQS